MRFLLALLLGLALIGCGDNSTFPDGSTDGAQDAGDGTGPADDGSAPADQTDAGDPGADSGQDGEDAGGDTQSDAGQDAGADSGWDAGTDAGEDAGADSGDSNGDQGQTVQGCIRGTGFQVYYGNLHSHTDYSDGDGTADEAFTWARDQAGLDIMILSDHIEQLYIPLSEYATCQGVSDSYYVPGEYLSDCAFEYAVAIVGLLGHNNVFFSPELFPLEADFEAFYPRLAACGTCVASFNHPGDSAGHTWKEFVYDAPADETLNLFEFNTDGDAWGLFFQAMDTGWHISPTYNQDNHGTDWGTKNDNRSAFFMTELSREALRQAILERRSFATTDKNSSIYMLADGECWMGSILSGVTSMDLLVVAEDPDAEDTFASIEFYSPEQTLEYTHDCAGATYCEASLIVPVSVSTYIVARANFTNGGFMIAAPIWASP
ncbi:MAG TPA: hypothetical protein VM425_19875 [Myxococcota bacterium]|nr:hypothetical protein [Myxococcota bacterium]